MPGETSAGPGGEEYLTSGEAARLLGVSPRTISRWADEGRIACIVTAGGHRRFTRCVVEQTRDSMEDD